MHPLYILDDVPVSGTLLYLVLELSSLEICGPNGDSRTVAPPSVTSNRLHWTCR